MRQTKSQVKSKYPETFCVGLTGAALKSERGYVVYNHGRINEGGYRRVGFGKTPSAAWSSVEL